MDLAFLFFIAPSAIPGALNASNQPGPPPKPPPDDLEMVVFVLAISLMLMGPLIWFLAPLWTAKRKKQQAAEQNRAHEEQLLLQPAFQEIELRLGFRVPQQMRELYADRETIVRTDFYVLDPTEEDAVWLISRFLPANLHSVDQLWPKLGDAFVFATNG
jgi:hypothetical protein